MKIKFNLDNIYNERELYYGNQKRYSSMTSIVFINEHLLVCASYYNKKLYLIDFDIEKNTYNIIHIVNSYGSKNHLTSSDLIDYNGEYIVTSNLSSCSISLYKIEKERIVYIKSIINKEYGLCHGVKFNPFYKNIVFFSTTGSKNAKCGVYAINYNIASPTPFFTLTHNNMLAKDLCFSNINKNILFVLFSENAPSPTEMKIYTCKVIMYNINIDKNEKEEIYELNFDKTFHGDCIQYHNNKLYLTSQEINSEGFIYEILIEDNKLFLNRKINGYSFPHGLDIRYNLIGITEYGNNSIFISTFDDF